MAFGRRRKLETELIELVRGELASIRSDVQSTLTETAAVLSARVRTELEQRMGEPSALTAGIQGVRDTIAARDTDLVHALQRVVSTCESLGEKLQVDRLESTALVDAISRLTTALAVTGTFTLSSMPTPSSTQVRPTVIGGTVDPSQPQASPTEAIAARAETIEPPVEIDADEIDLEAVARAPQPVESPNPPRPGRPVRPDGVEVRCRFGDRWVTGFEVCEVIRLDDVTRYRLRRRSDGSVIPTLFDEKDLRFFSTTFVDP